MTTTTEINNQIAQQQDLHIDGITFRGFRGKEDFKAMAAIINEANKVDGNDFVANAEDISVNYAYLERSDTNQDMIFVEDRSKAIGYGRCAWHKEDDGPYLYTFFIHLVPEYRQSAIPLAMIEFLRERLLVIAGEHPDDAPKFFQTWGTKDMKWSEDLMEQLGFKAVRYGFSMKRPCSQPVDVNPLPEGLEVRLVGPEDYRKVFEANSEAFRDHWGYVAPTEKDYQHFLNAPNFDPSIWQVAWEGDKVAGMVLNFIDHKENEALDRKIGYTEDICVRRPWRRQGVARALLTQSIQMFQEMGMEETRLGVDTENPNGALKLYQSVGYTEFRCGVTYRAKID